jgi:hypothetical protein
MMLEKLEKKILKENSSYLIMLTFFTDNLRVIGGHQKFGFWVVSFAPGVTAVENIMCLVY